MNTILARKFYSRQRINEEDFLEQIKEMGSSIRNNKWKKDSEYSYGVNGVETVGVDVGFTLGLLYGL